MFAFMHNQMLARYNVDRLSVDLPLVSPYGPKDWLQPVYPGYNPQLGSTTNSRFANRPNGSSLNEWGRFLLNQDVTNINGAINNRLLNLTTGAVNLRYWSGMDLGIGPLADVVEPLIENS